MKPETRSAAIPIAGLAHIGIRVHDLERSVRFYALLGFRKTAGPIGSEPVAVQAINIAVISSERELETPISDPLNDPSAAPDPLPTEPSRIVVAWFTFGSLAVCVLGAGTARS